MHGTVLLLTFMRVFRKLRGKVSEIETIQCNIAQATEPQEQTRDNDILL